MGLLNQTWQWERNRSQTRRTNYSVVQGFRMRLAAQLTKNYVDHTKTGVIGSLNFWGLGLWELEVEVEGSTSLIQIRSILGVAEV